MSEGKDSPDDFQFRTSEWTQDEIDALHDMVRDYDRAKWLRGQLKWWAIWILGLPTASVTIWKAVEELWRMATRGHS